MVHASSPPVTFESLQTGRHVMILDSHDPQGSGILLCRRYTADLILTGSLVGGSVDARGFERVIPLGQVHLVFPSDEEDRQAGFERRMQSIAYQQEVIGDPVALDRARKLLELLYSWFDSGVINSIVDTDLAKAAGVLASTMALGKERFKQQMAMAA